MTHQEPNRGVENTTPIGGPIWIMMQGNAVPGVTTVADIGATLQFGQTVNLPAGTSLITIRQKKLKACREEVVYTLGGVSQGGWKDCLIDTDSDGKFDRVALNQLSGAKDIIPPVSYTQGPVMLTGGGAATFRKMLIFLGAAEKQLRLSYREFANDMARPAFTEELILPLGETFPQTFAVKDLKMTVLKVDGGGLTYRLDE